MMRFFGIQPRYLLPLMILTAVLTVGLRLGDIWETIAGVKPYTSVRLVQAATEEKKAEDKKDTAAAPAGAAPVEGKSEEKKEVKKEEKQVDKPVETRAAKEIASPESDLYKQLAGRRDQLDKRAQELDTREALVVVTEKRIDQKIKEMEELRGQLQKLVGQASEAQQAQLDNLVKVYEIMKPKEAAQIFETLEMPILLGVVQKMKPARTAAVLAEMNPEKAKEVTTALTRQDQLPQVK